MNGHNKASAEISIEILIRENTIYFLDFAAGTRLSSLEDNLSRTDVWPALAIRAVAARPVLGTALKESDGHFFEDRLRG